MEMKIDRLRKLLKLHITKKRPLFIHGSMGIGKSYMVEDTCREIAKERGLEFAKAIATVEASYDGTTVKVNRKFNDPKKYFILLDVRITSLDPSDIRGVPFPEGNHVRWLTPDWLPQMGQGCIFFDEMNLAPHSIQASAYQLVLDRRVGDYVLPDGYNIIAAGNRSCDGANVIPMSAPLRNRFSHAELMPPSDEEWVNWALENGVKPRVTSFIMFKPSLLHKYEKSSKDQAFPTHRTWTLFSTLAEDDMPEEEEFELCASCVGEGAAREFRAFVKLRHKINIDEILKDPKKVQKITDIGLKHSLVSGVVEKYIKKRDILEKALELTNYLDEEFAVFLLRMMKAPDKMKFMSALMKSKAWNKIAKDYAKYLI